MNIVNAEISTCRLYKPEGWYCLEEIQGKYLRVEFDESEKIVRMMHIIKPYEMIFSDYERMRLL